MNCYYYEIEVANKLGDNDVNCGYCCSHSLTQAIKRIVGFYSLAGENKVLSLDTREVDFRCLDFLFVIIPDNEVLVDTTDC